MNKKALVSGLLVLTALLTALMFLRDRPADEAVPFLQLEPDQLSGEVLRWVEAHRARAIETSATFGGYTYLLVAAGQKPTGGYQVSFEQVRQDGDRLVVEVVVQAPKPGSSVTTAVTYPVGIARVSQTALPVLFSVAEGR